MCTDHYRWVTFILKKPHKCLPSGFIDALVMDMGKKRIEIENTQNTKILYADCVFVLRYIYDALCFSTLGAVLHTVKEVNFRKDGLYINQNYTKPQREAEEEI